LALKGQRFHRLLKTSIVRLILGGAAVHRCGKCIVLNPALAAEGNGGIPRNSIYETRSKYVAEQGSQRSL
jgi:hypothetical protein